MDNSTKSKLTRLLKDGQVDKALAFIEAVETIKKQQITDPQRGSIHKYLSMVAHEANNMGLTLQEMVKVVTKLEIRPNTTNLKETFLKPYIKRNFDLDSSEKMNNEQINEAYDALNKVFSFYWHIHIPFPCDEEKGKERLKASEMRKNVDYPEYKEPTI